MTSMKVLWLVSKPDACAEGKKKLEENGCEVLFGNVGARVFTEDEIFEKGRNVDAIITGPSISGRILKGLKKLKIVVKGGIGVDNIDVDVATQLGILVANTPVPADYIGVAEGAVARILALAKKLLTCDQSVKKGVWTKETDNVISTYVRGKTLGIIGLGRIGSTIAKFMSPWGMKILASDPYINEDKALLLGVELVDLDTLLKESDFISINATLTLETRNLINETSFKKMKRSSYIINTARGAIIDAEALSQALKDGIISGAALDVYETEPLPAESGLLIPEIADKLILSPHVAGMNPEMRQSTPITQAEYCLEALHGIPPKSTINPEAISKWKKRFGFI